ncbi:hypothetical protein GN958_ATG04533 [Phytophthora infestans]|uniref:Uncharacterized protein n=1 Tax=Phytophthora infestans TaxID=4787 RepID=A0A8S9V0A2_PHYIN|nr:hypothetical protein GN958_ATG04533 [Phytophthora infestans]
METSAKLLREMLAESEADSELIEVSDLSAGPGPVIDAEDADEVRQSPSNAIVSDELTHCALRKRHLLPYVTPSEPHRALNSFVQELSAQTCELDAEVEK